MKSSTDDDGDIHLDLLLREDLACSRYSVWRAHMQRAV